MGTAAESEIQNPIIPLRSIIQKLLNSKINISPAALVSLQKINPNKDTLEQFIRKVSFSPEGHHVTEATILKEFLGQNASNDSEDPRNKSTDILPNEGLEVPLNPQDTTDGALGSGTGVDNEIHQLEAEITIDRQAEEKVEENLSPAVILPEEEIPNPKSEEICEPTQQVTKQNEAESEITEIRKKKREQWESLSLRSGTSTFRPLAADYDAEYQVLSDPTGKLFVDGKIGDFLNVQVDKYTKLRKTLEQRKESSGVLDINFINRRDYSVEVTFIGMVIQKRQTASKNYLIELEDPTGTCMGLVRNKNPELYEMMSKILPDHVLLVEGFLSVNREKNSRIILINNIYFPDTPNHHPTNHFPKEDLAICMLSDIHFGSKDFLDKVWAKFVDFANCRLGTDKQRELAGKIKYLTIAGDLVDGIGVYPNQDRRLNIVDIIKQYDDAAEHLAKLPDYITVIFSPGDHDAVHKAIPTNAVPTDIAGSLYDRGVKMVGCPAMVSLHGIKTQLFHGTSLIDMNMSIPGLTNEDPHGTMVEYIRARHMAPSYGGKTELAPTEKDWLVMDTIPDVLHTGHLHKSGYGFYHGILTVNSGCFQAQTDYMRSFGINPDFGKPTIVGIQGPRLQPKVIDLVGE